MARILAALALLFAGCTHPAPSRTATPAPVIPSATPATRASSLGRVAVLVLENKEYDELIGNPEAPFLNALAREGALATRFYATRHPSLPNYLALLGGSTFGITSDCTSCRADGPSLVGALDRAGITWRAYVEGLPEPCFTGASAGRYAKKHNPFAYFADARCDHVVGLDHLAGDLADLPRFVWIAPDMCHSTHDCTVRDGDGFLSSIVPGLLRALGPHGVLFLTVDEGRSDLGCCGVASGGHVATILAGPGARAGARSDRPYSQYSILRTIGEGWGLPLLGQASCPCTSSMDDLLAAS